MCFVLSYNISLFERRSLKTEYCECVIPIHSQREFFRKRFQWSLISFFFICFDRAYEKVEMLSALSTRQITKCLKLNIYFSCPDCFGFSRIYFFDREYKFEDQNFPSNLDKYVFNRSSQELQNMHTYWFSFLNEEVEINLNMHTN